MTRTVPWSDRVSVRRQLARHLLGEGVELGPGHDPFPVPFPGTVVRYVDRWEPDENAALFPELGGATFPKPDIVANLDADGLSMLEDTSQDFVVASHILEHVADPIRLLDDIARVCRPGGIALVLLPDRRRTFDATRPPTTLAHLLAEHEAAPVEVDDEHIIEFIEHVEPPEVVDRVHADPAAMVEEIARHRTRSIHAHCWQEEEFAEVLHHCVLERRHQWEFVDGVLAEEEGPEGHEFGYVLRRTTTPVEPAVLAERFRLTYEAWLAERRAVLQAAYTLQAQSAATPPAPSGGLRAIGRRVKAVARR